MPDSFHALTLTGLYHGQTIQNVFHFRNLDRAASNQFLAEDFASNIIPAWQVLVHDSFQFQMIQTVEIRNPAPMPAHIMQVNLLGGGGVTQSHSVSAFKIRKITARGGRRGFGKFYIGGIPTNLLDGNYVIGFTGRNRMLTLMSGLESRYCDGVAGQPFFRMVLLHKDVNDPPDNVTHFEMYPVVGVQRRRNKFVGI